MRLPRSRMLAALCALACMAVGSVVGIVIAEDDDPPRIEIVDPCAGCSDTERQTQMDGQLAEMFASRDELAGDFAGMGVDPRDLPRRTWLRDYLPGYAEPFADVSHAAVGASSIVEVEVTNVEFVPGDHVRTVVQVLDVIKGSAMEELEILQDGAVMRDAETDTLAIVEADAMPLLLPGDRAVLLLEVVSGVNRIIPGYGWLKITDGFVNPPPGLESERTISPGTPVAEARAWLSGVAGGGSGG